MSKVGLVEGPSDPFILSVAVQGPLPDRHSSTASLAPGPSFVQSASHVGLAEGSLAVSVSLSKDMGPKVSLAGGRARLLASIRILYPASPVFSPVLSRALTASLRPLTLLKFSQLVSLILSVLRSLPAIPRY